MSTVKLFVRSFGVGQNIEDYVHAGAHTYCAPEMTSGLRGMSGFRGRLLEKECADLIPHISAMSDRTGREVEVIDLSRLPGKFKALRNRVWKTPALLIDDQRHIGFEAARDAARSLH
jgi:hypothetical protein